MQEDTLEHALKYARAGVHIFPCHGIDDFGYCTCGNKNCRTAGKHPHSQLAPRGFYDATRDEEKIRFWFSSIKNLNIGMPTGKINGFSVLDIDPRNGGDDTIQELEKKNGKLKETLTQVTGGSGTHYLYKTNARLRSPGRGVDVKNDGGYIIVEPSKHQCGGKYFFESEEFSLDQISEAPEFLTEQKIITAHNNAASSSFGLLPQSRIAEIKAALYKIDASNYETWIKVGLALYSLNCAEAYEMWDEWSKTASNYDSDNVKKWDSFKNVSSVNIETVFFLANESIKSVPAESIQIVEEQQKENIPINLLTVPGVLGNFVDWTNETSPKKQPQFSVQAALALGSICMSRRWRTTSNNYSSLYFLNVGKSASGKEHARTAIETALAQSNLEHLIGPSGYTSDSAVFSTLMMQPAHITIIDEFGAMLGNNKAQNNFHKRQSLDLLTQIWGLCHSVLRAQSYSTMTLNKKQKSEIEKRIIQNPAITLLGMTTPKTFYSSLNEQSIEGGFLNRLMIVESEIGAQERGEFSDEAMPISVSQWCYGVATASATSGNLSSIELGQSTQTIAKVVDIDDKAKEIFKNYEKHCINNMNALEHDGLAEMQGRSLEKAMRIALVVAVSIDPISSIINELAASWAVQYVKYYTEQTIEAVRKNLHNSKFAEQRATVLELLKKAGKFGLTEREMARKSRVFAGLDIKTREMIFKTLVSEQEIALIERATSCNLVKTRAAWVLIKNEE